MLPDNRFIISKSHTWDSLSHACFKCIPASYASLLPISASCVPMLPIIPCFDTNFMLQKRHFSLTVFFILHFPQSAYTVFFYWQALFFTPSSSFFLNQTQIRLCFRNRSFSKEGPACTFTCSLMQNCIVATMASSI